MTFYNVLFVKIVIVMYGSNYLGIAQAETLGYLISVRRCEVLLIQESFFELIDLLVGEGRSRLSSLFRRLGFTEQT